METDSPVVYHGTTESRFPQKEAHVPLVQLTPEEKDVLRKCNKESLYYRCIPFAVVGMAATHYATHKGFLTPHPVWGSTLKMTGAAVIGWVFGKFSYRKICEDKFLHLENSSIGDAVRRKRGYVLDKYRTERDGFKTEPFEQDRMLKDDSFTYLPDSGYHSSSGSLNLDVDKNIQYSGLDDLERPSTDRETIEIPEEVEPVKVFTTYEDLRKRNREEYERSLRTYEAKRDQSIQSASPKPWSNVDSTSVRRSTTDINAGGTKNIYGDTWDNSKFL